MKSAFAFLALFGLAACNADTPIGTDSSVGPPLFARGGSQTLYGITFQQGIESDLTHPFAALAKTGDPYSGSVSGDPVYLSLPGTTAGDAEVCDQDGSGLGATTASWGGYAGIWKGSFSISAKGSTYHVAYNATREDGTGWLWLVVNGTGVKTNNNLTLTFTNRRGLVSAYSTPTGSFDPRVGPFDPQDRCLTFSITAAP
jgi:hypothetical protein